MYVCASINLSHHREFLPQFISIPLPSIIIRYNKHAFELFFYIFQFLDRIISIFIFFFVFAASESMNYEDSVSQWPWEKLQAFELAQGYEYITLGAGCATFSWRLVIALRRKLCEALSVECFSLASKFMDVRAQTFNIFGFLW